MTLPMIASIDPRQGYSDSNFGTTAILALRYGDGFGGACFECERNDVHRCKVDCWNLEYALSEHRHRGKPRKSRLSPEKLR